VTARPFAQSHDDKRAEDAVAFAVRFDGKVLPTVPPRKRR
jgi:hypothetical protein